MASLFVYFTSSQLKIHHFRKEKGTGPVRCPAIILFLESVLLGVRRSAIDQFFGLTPVTEPEVFTKPYSAKFPSHCSSSK